VPVHERFYLETGDAPEFANSVTKLRHGLLFTGEA
jgi:hypothetical protein